MTQIGSIQNPLPHSPAAPERALTDRQAPLRHPAPTDDDHDRVELSPEAARGDPAAALEARIAEIRAQIADGTYVTPEKIDVVVERLHEWVAPS